MSRYTHLPRTKTKQKNEFISFFDRVFHVLSSNKRVGTIAIIIFVLLLAGSAILKKRAEKNRQASAVNLYSAVKAVDPIEALTALSTAGGDLAWLSQTDLVKKQKEKQEEKQEGTFLDTLLKIQNEPAVLSPLKLYSQAQVLWQQGKADQALKLVDGIRADFFSDRLSFLKAELLVALSRGEDASRIFKTLSDSAEDEDIKKKAKAYLAIVKH